MALLDSKQLNPRLTGSFTLSGSLTGDSNTIVTSFKRVNSTSGSFNRLYASQRSDILGGPIALASDTTLSAKGNTGASFGDDVGTWEFDGNGTVTTTAMSSLTLTPLGILDIDAGDAVKIDGTTLTVGGDGDTGAIGITATSAALTLTGGAASTWSILSGSLTINGTTGISLQESGSNVIAIDTNRDVLFSQTGGTVSDPDVEIDGYFKVDGQTTFTAPISASSDISGSSSTTASFGRIDTAGSIYASGRVYEAGTSIVDHATAMAIVFGG